MLSDYGTYGSYGFATFKVPFPNAPMELTFPTSRADLDTLTAVRRMENGNAFYCVDDQTEKVLQSARVAAMAGSGVIFLAAAALPANRGGLRTATYLAGVACLGWHWLLYSRMRRLMQTPEAVASTEAAEDIAAVVAEVDAAEANAAGYGYYGH
jgi:hypothetical protein